MCIYAVKFPSRLILPILLLVLMLCDSWAEAIEIPEQSDWTEMGVAVSPGSSGSWDARLGGAISPATMVKRDGTYYLYYVGADGDRSTDGGPRHRALGVATSTDGINFSKYTDNPILTHLPHNNQEEGIFSAGAILDESGKIWLYYAALDAGNSTSETVDSDIRLASSLDGLNFTDIGDVVSSADNTVWGYGDELFPVGATRTGSTWSVYYVSKGIGTHWDLGRAWGPSAANLSNTGEVLDASDLIVGGVDPVFLGPDEIVLPIVMANGDFDTPWEVEFRTVPVTNPSAVSGPVETYNFPDFTHTTLFFDEDINTWFMYYLNNAEDEIRVKTFAVAVAGDFDLDGDVDGADFLKWQRGESSNPLSQSDLADWEANYGFPLAAASTAVPEPSTWIVLLIGMMAQHFPRDVVVSYAYALFVNHGKPRAS